MGMASLKLYTEYFLHFHNSFFFPDHVLMVTSSNTNSNHTYSVQYTVHSVQHQQIIFLNEQKLF